MKLSVTIVTRQRKDDLGKVLDDLRQQTRLADEVIVLDNASTDGTAQMLREAFTDVRVIRSDKNLGCPGGRNVAYREATGDIVVSLDDDLVLPPEALARFEESVVSDPRIGLVFARIVNYDDGSETRWHCGGPPPRPDDGRRYTWTFVAGATAVRATALAGSGFYPDDYVRQCEEFDLSYRLLEAGWRILYDPKLTCQHKSSPRGRVPADIAFYQTRNDLWTCWRNLPPSAAVTYSFWKSLRYPLSFSRQGLGLSSLRGVTAALRGLPKVLRSRRVISPRTWRLIRVLKRCVITSPELIEQVESRAGS